MCNSHGFCAYDSTVKESHCFCNQGYSGDSCLKSDSTTSSGTAHSSNGTLVSVLSALLAITVILVIFVAYMAYSVMKFRQQQQQFHNISGVDDSRSNSMYSL